MSRKWNTGYKPGIRMNEKGRIYVEITEQPVSEGTRFRYEKEERFSGPIKGVNSTEKCKTWPTIRIHGYDGDAFVIVSLVTINGPPYYPHPNKLIGKNCVDGIYPQKINKAATDTAMICSFDDLRIQRVKMNEVKEALELREKHQVDPFGTGFSHSSDKSKIEFKAVRLCFQVFLPGENGKKEPLSPVISSVIHDSNYASDLSIMELSQCTAPVCGKEEIILLCGRINKEYIQIVFEEKKDNETIWTDHGKFLPHNVHYNTAITFKTPAYKDLNIREEVNCFIYLRRTTDDFVGKPRKFTLLPFRVDNKSRRKIRSVRTAGERKNCAENQLLPCSRRRKEFNPPETINVEGNANDVKRLFLAVCKYQNFVPTAVDIANIISSLTHQQVDGLFPSNPPLNPLNNTGTSEDYFATTGHTSQVMSPYELNHVDDAFPADTPPILINNAVSLGNSILTAKHTSRVFSPNACQTEEDTFSTISPQIQLANDGIFRDSIEKESSNKISNLISGSNAKDSVTLSGYSIDSDTDIKIRNMIGSNNGKSGDETHSFNDNDTATDHCQDELSLLNLDLNSCDLDTNSNRFTVNSIPENVAISISLGSYDDKVVDEGMSFPEM